MKQQQQPRYRGRRRRKRRKKPRDGYEPDNNNYVGYISMFTMVVIQCNDSTLTVCGCFGSLWVSRVAIDNAYDTFIVGSAIINPQSYPRPFHHQILAGLRRTTKSGINSAKHTETQSESWLSVCLSVPCLSVALCTGSTSSVQGKMDPSSRYLWSKCACVVWRHRCLN